MISADRNLTFKDNIDGVPFPRSVSTSGPEGEQGTYDGVAQSGERRPVKPFDAGSSPASVFMEPKAFDDLALGGRPSGNGDRAHGSSGALPSRACRIVLTLLCACGHVPLDPLPHRPLVVGVDSIVWLPLVQRAAHRWNKAAGCDLIFVTSSPVADIAVEVWDEPRGYAARGVIYLPQVGATAFDDEAVDLVAHELGHTLGIRHHLSRYWCTMHSPPGSEVCSTEVTQLCGG